MFIYTYEFRKFLRTSIVPLQLVSNLNSADTRDLLGNWHDREYA